LKSGVESEGDNVEKGEGSGAEEEGGWIFRYSDIGDTNGSGSDFLLFQYPRKLASSLINTALSLGDVLVNFPTIFENSKLLIK
jgi:hypothetical protein